MEISDETEPQPSVPMVMQRTIHQVCHSLFTLPVLIFLVWSFTTPPFQIGYPFGILRAISGVSSFGPDFGDLTGLTHRAVGAASGEQVQSGHGFYHVVQDGVKIFDSALPF